MTFQNSFALLNSENRLVDWDDGFTLEWAEVAHLIEKGASIATITQELVRLIGRNHVDKENVGSADTCVREYVEGGLTERSFDYRTLAGRIIHVDETCTYDGGLLRLARDVSEEWLNQRALEKAREHLRGAGAPGTGTYIEIIRNPDGDYEFPRITEGVRDLLGLPADCVGQETTVLDAKIGLSPEEHANRTAALENSVRTLEPCHWEYRVGDGEDELRWFRHSMVPRHKADGSVLFSGTIANVTHEKRAEDRIELLQSIVVRSDDSIVVFETTADRATKIVYVNPKFERLFGALACDLIGRPASVLRRDVLSRASAAMLAEAYQRDDGRPMEFESCGAGGQIFWVEARVARIQNSHEGALRWMVFSRDISERRNAERELQRAKEAAEAGSRSKSEFLATMSHELRTPLNAIIGFSEFLDMKVRRDGWSEAYLEYLSDINASGRHLLDVINSVLDLSQIEAGALVMDLQPVLAEEIVRICVALLKVMALDGGVTIFAESPPAPATILGDYLKVKQVMLNIMSNAIKFTPPGGRITVASKILAGQVNILVTDTGCGIAPADLHRVTQPFVQFEPSLSKKYRGSGLGLSIAKQLCQLHGGDLTIVSTQGVGTTVTIKLPAVAI